MGQDRVNGLATLAIESYLAKSLNFDSIIDSFASKKARKAPLLNRKARERLLKLNIIEYY